MVESPPNGSTQKNKEKSTTPDSEDKVGAMIGKRSTKNISEMNICDGPDSVKVKQEQMLDSEVPAASPQKK